ncbi:MAG: vitamin K epoxide reductase family protein [Candidatus Gracilibacteria bacterium]|jgi:uncharacterized membrane protein
MNNLEHSSEKPSNNQLIYASTVISYIGFLDAIYLTVEHYTGAGLKCIIFTGCDQVANSSYSIMFGLPVALWGALFYLSILLLSLLCIDLKDHPIKEKHIFRIIPIFTLLGFMFTLRFIYLQVYVIKAICVYCMFSAITSTLLFMIGAVLFRRMFYKFRNR